MKMRKLVAVLLAVLMLCSIIPFSAAAEGNSATITFDDTSKRIELSTGTQVWKEDGITVTNNKDSSTSNVADYAKPARFYKNSTLIVEYAGMTKIEFNCNTAAYATALQSAILGADVTVSDKVVAVTLNGEDSFSCVLSGGQVRVDSITVYGEGGGETPDTPVDPEPDEPDTPAIPNGPELTIADAIALGQTFEHNTFSETKYYVTGVITEVYNTMWGNMYITDGEGNILTIYGTYSADGETRYDAMEYAPVAGDTVVLYGIIGQYNGNSQMKNGWVIGVIGGDTPVDPDPDVPSNDPEADTELSIADAIALGLSKEHNGYTEGKYYVTGVIAEVYNTQYGNMYITDGEGNTLLIYGTYSADGEIRYDAMDVQPVAGDTVTIYGPIGQYNGNAQIKNGWIVDHIPGEGGGTPVDPDPDVPVNPDDDIDTTIPYLLGMVQENVSTEDVYFLAGGMAQTYYFATTTDVDAAILVYLEPTDGGYYLYTMDGSDKLYINMVPTEDGAHVNGAYESTASTVYTYDWDLWTLVSEVNGDVYAFGTRNDKNYTTMGPVKVSYNGFHADLYYFEDDVEDPCEHEYDNDCDEECNLCGELREVVGHVYDDEYDADCNVCGGVREVPERPVYVGSIEASTNSAQAGKEVTVTVQVNDNPGIVSAKVKVYFDNSVLEFVSAVEGDFSAAGYSWSDPETVQEKGYVVINWCDATKPNSTAQLLATLTFRVKEDAADGFSAITLEFNCAADIFNAADETVWFEAVSGGVTIVAAPAVAPGDANGDGDVNNRDMALLQQNINGWHVSIDVDAMDVNNDGDVNNRDLALLQQYINGWDVTLG